MFIRLVIKSDRHLMNLINTALLQTKSYVNGRFIDAQDGHTFEVRNPYNGDVIAEMADCGSSDTRDAISAAQEAFLPWRSLTGTERGKVLRRWYELIVKHVDDLAIILTTEQGKPLREARGEVLYGASYVEWFAEEARRVYGDVIPGHQRDKRITVIKQAVGVVGAITPWNFPSAMITRKISPALAAGCSVVIKPSELTPLSATALAVLAEEAGIPPGVINIINTSRADQVGEALTSSSIVKKVSFTGSTAIGKLILGQCAETVKKVTLELGGNAPFIVFDDADILAAVDGVIAAKFRNAGQTCICPNRIFVQETVYDQFVNQLSDKMKSLQLGSGLNSDVSIGPLIEEKAIQSVETVVADALSKGAQLNSGGERKSETSPLLYEPTVLTEVTPEMDVFNQEIFGPVVPVIRFNTEQEVINLANQTPYGLAAYFYGQNYAILWRVAEALEYGMVGINTGMIGTAVAPFGGIKESGFGREGSGYGIDEYLVMKYMCWAGVESLETQMP